MSSSERRMAAQAAAHTSWAHTPDRNARTAKARAALMAKFELEVDPTGVLPPQERAKRAESARKAYFLRLALTSARARRARTVVAEGEAADVVLAALVGEAS